MIPQLARHFRGRPILSGFTVAGIVILVNAITTLAVRDFESGLVSGSLAYLISFLIARFVFGIQARYILVTFGILLALVLVMVVALVLLVVGSGGI